MIKTLTAAIAASLIASAAPAVAKATSQNPIELQRVTASAERESIPGGVRIVFENTADLPAREVTFHIQDPGGRQADIKDVGSFAPGVSIVHEFAVAVHDTPSVKVSHVELADGTTWDEPAPLSPQPRPQASLDEAVPADQAAL